MNMKTYRNFLLDQLWDLIGYLCVTVLIVFYFYLKSDHRMDLLYPLVLMLFVFCVITTLKAIRYSRFHKTLYSGTYTEFLTLNPSFQEREVIEVLQKLQKEFHSQLGQEIMQREKTYAFVAHMAHDLKIPVSVMKLILEEENAPLSSEVSHKILQESDKLLDKLSQLLSYLRLGRFEKDYTIEEVNLIEEIRNAINYKKDYFILNHIYPQFHSNTESVSVYTDRKWNGMLLDQLISNAVKYSAVKQQKGYILFEVISTGQEVELAITDNGIGIPSYDIPRIFEPFFTGENGRLVRMSSGIGLYLCRTIADKLGHSLKIESVYGERTCAKIRYLSKL